MLTRAEKAAPANDVPKAPLAKAASLLFEPASLTLEDGRDERRVIVWGVTKEGEKFDLSSDAILELGLFKPNIAGPSVRISKLEVYPGLKGQSFISL